MNHISLAELNAMVKQTLDSNLQPSYWVVAEIGDLRVNQRGHCYLELIEKEGESLLAKAKGTIWSYTYRNLSTWFQSMTGESLQPGLKVLLNIQVQFHELYGFSLNVRDIDPNYTLGEKARKKQEVISRLVEDGVFEMNRSLPLPLVPQRIAVISSPAAAGYEDFINQLHANSHGFQLRVRLFKSIMQGPEATESIIDSLHRINDLHEDFDAVVMIRGGGSQVDLDCFDTYELTSHMAQFPLPIITGLGHERDESVADLVAHTKLKTPTAVSEFLLQGMLDFENQIGELANRLNYVAMASIGETTARLLALNQEVFNVSRSAIYDHQRYLDQFGTKLALLCKSNLSDNLMRLNAAEHALKLVDPKMVLKRGFTITRVNNKPITASTTINDGDEVYTEGYNFQLTSSVIKRKKDD